MVTSHVLDKCQASSYLNSRIVSDELWCGSLFTVIPLAASLAMLYYYSQFCTYNKMLPETELKMVSLICVQILI